MLLALLALAAAQHSDKLPPANPIPMTADGEEERVLAAVGLLLRALEKDDAPGVIAATRAEGIATVAYEGANGARGVKSVRWADLAAGLKPSTDRVEERLGTSAVELDGDVAMVWAPYSVLVNGKVHHCGYDHFDLVRQTGAWKVLNVTWSQRAEGCAQP